MSGPWTNDKEEEFVCMMEARPELFDNTEMNFSNKAVKMNAWFELAQHFHISEKELRKKWDSLRTQYSRYTKLVYGSDGRFFTPRQQWIMQRLKFLDPHIKRRSNYCAELDYEVTVVENGSDGASPAQVDVELEAESLNKLELNLEASKPPKQQQLPKRPVQDDDSDSLRSCGAKKSCSEKSVPPPSQTAATRQDEDEDSDTASLRRTACCPAEDRLDERWDGFSSHVVTCIRSLDSSRGRAKAQEDVSAVLQRHMERDGDEDEDEDGDGGPGACWRTCATCCGTRKRRRDAPDDQDDLEPFLKSMAIIMRRLPLSERSEVKFRIHELVYKAEMKQLGEPGLSQNPSPPHCERF